MTATFADMHCHLELFDDPRKLAEQCASRGVRVLAVTASPRSWRKFCSMVDGVAGVRPALGLHPQLGTVLRDDVRLFEELSEHATYIGEVGLDASKDHAATFDLQAKTFQRVLRIASEQRRKVISVHSVRAAREVLELLEKDFDFSTGRVILHWFTGTKDLCRRAAELGCYFSVNAQMLRSANGRSIALAIPPTRLLTESDGPFVLEHGRPATPLTTEGVVKMLAHLRGSTAAATAALLSDNLRELVTPREAS